MSMVRNSSSLTFKLLKIASFVFSIGLMLLVLFVFYTDLHLYARPLPQNFDQMITEQMEAAKLPGASVLVFKEGKILFSKQYGLANIEKQQSPTEQSLFQVASVSKLVTGTAVLKLYEQGKLQLDDDINQYLPFSVRNPNYPNSPITFRMLLSHVSSISDGSFFFGSPYWDMYKSIGQLTQKTESSRAFVTSYFTPGSSNYDLNNSFNESKPGSMAEYSNAAYGLLGYLVAEISGMAFNEFCRQEIFLPLGMKYTRWLSHNVDKNKMVMPYNFNLQSNSYHAIGAYDLAIYADGGLKTSSIEFMRFLHVFVNNGYTLTGEPFLTSKTVQEMLTVQYPEINDVSGLTWWIEDSNYLHGGSDPGAKALVVLSKHEKWGFIFFANGGGLRTEIGFEFKHYVHEYLNSYGPPSS